MKKLYSVLLLTVICCFLLIACSKGIKEELEADILQVKEEKLTEDLDKDALNALNNNKLKITNNPETGLPRQISGIFSTKTIQTAEDALYAMMSVRTFMQIEGREFICVEEDFSDDEKNVFFFLQVYEGLPVEQGVFRVSATKEGTPLSLYGTYCSGIDVATTPTITAEEAKQEVTLADDAKIESVQLVICRHYT